MKRIVVSAEVAATSANGNGSRRVWVGKGDDRQLLTFSREPVFLPEIPPELEPHVASGRLLVTDLPEAVAAVAIQRQAAAAGNTATTAAAAGTPPAKGGRKARPATPRRASAGAKAEAKG
jgi:hypothetical protein